MSSPARICSSFSTDCESSDSCWNYIDNILLHYEEKIRKEQKLLNEVWCDIEDGFKISTGISPARSFINAVRIFKNSTIISLCDTEWRDLIDNLEKFIQPDGDEGYESQTSFFCDKVTLKIETSGPGEKRLILKAKERGNSITLTVCDSEKIINFKNFINFRLSVLTHLNFPQYYNNILDYVLISKENCIDVIKNICVLNYSENPCVMLELLNSHPEKIIQDLDKMYLH